MLTSAPWLTANNPLDFMRAGTSAGLQHLSISNAAAEAGDRIKLGFAELNQRAADAAANRAQEASNAAAQLRESVAQRSLANMFRDREISTEEERTRLAGQKLSDTEGKKAAVQLVHAGSGVYGWDGSNLTPLLKPEKKTNPYDIATFRNLLDQKKSIGLALLNPATAETDKALLRKQLDIVNGEINQRNPSSVKLPSPADVEQEPLSNAPPTPEVPFWRKLLQGAQSGVESLAPLWQSDSAPDMGQEAQPMKIGRFTVLPVP